MSGKSVPVLYRIAQMKPGRLPGLSHILLHAGPRVPHDLVAGEADLRRFLQGGPGHDALGAQEDPVGLGDLDPQPGRLLVEPRRCARPGVAP